MKSNIKFHRTGTLLYPEYHSSDTSYYIWRATTYAEFGSTRWCVSNDEDGTPLPLDPAKPHWTHGTLNQCKEAIRAMVAREAQIAAKSAPAAQTSTSTAKVSETASLEPTPANTITGLYTEFKNLKALLFPEGCSFVVIPRPDEDEAMAQAHARYDQLLAYFYPSFRTSSWVNPRG